VTDSFKVTLRTGPSSENKIIAMPSSGQPVKVLDSRGNWSHLRLLAMVWTTKRATAGAQWRKIKRSNASRKGRPIDFGQRNKWFAIGALVLLFGLMIGFVMGRQKKKHCSFIYF